VQNPLEMDQGHFAVSHRKDIVINCIDIVCSPHVLLVFSNKNELTSTKLIFINEVETKRFTTMTSVTI